MQMCPYCDKVYDESDIPVAHSVILTMTTTEGSAP